MFSIWVSGKDRIMSISQEQIRQREQLEIIVRGRQASLSQKFRDHAVEKLKRISRYSIPFHRIDIEVSHEANPRQADRAFEVELTCNGVGPLVRAEAHASDKYVALDFAYDKLQEQLRRMHEKTKSIEHKRFRAVSPLSMDGATPITVTERAIQREEKLAAVEMDDIVMESGPLVVRTKNIESTPMTVEQAVEAMELVGHDFFVFRNVETGLCNVLYRRRGYDFGLMELRDAS